MKYPFFKTENALPAKTFEKMLKELPPIEKVTCGVRSHKDIHVQDEIFQTMPTWKRFAEMVYSGMLWVPYLPFLQSENLRFPYSVDMYDPSFIEPRSGAVKTDKVFFYSRLDIGYGVEGYGAVNGGRGIHIDMPQRLISSLIYFSDQSDFTGGEFIAYNNYKVLNEVVKIKPNLMISSIQNENAWHSVNPIKSCKKPRIAAYMALSCSRPIWNTR